MSTRLAFGADGQTNMGIGVLVSNGHVWPVAPGEAVVKGLRVVALFHIAE